MQVGRRLSETFRARDEQGNEYEVTVYVHTARDDGPAAAMGSEHHQY